MDGNIQFWSVRKIREKTSKIKHLLLTSSRKIEQIRKTT